jgi:hypothetical protein
LRCSKLLIIFKIERFLAKPQYNQKYAPRKEALLQIDVGRRFGGSAAVLHADPGVERHLEAGMKAEAAK